VSAIRRRSVLLAALAPAVVAACSRRGSDTAGRWQTSGSSPSAQSPATGIQEQSLPAVTAYTVSPDEPAPDVKWSAVRFLEALTNYSDGGAAPEAAQARLAAVGVPSTLIAEAGPLLATGAAAGEVIYPQLGGLTSTTASIMAVIRTHLLHGGRVTSTTRTVDVRLTKRSDSWAVSALASNGGSLPAVDNVPSETASAGTGPVPSLANEVLTSPRIELSDTTRSDVRAGRIDTRILRLLLELTAQRRVAVTVLASGHPHEVFGTNRVSNHTRGRAVDIWAVDGRTVAQQRSEPSSAARQLTLQALNAGATEVGAPWVLSAAGRSSFTNTVHEDHIHIGLDR
jgi:hypothetical protein